jgi:hypothetical protein
MKSEQGFTVSEVLVAATLAIVIMGGTLGSLNDALGLNEKTNLIADLGQNLRAGLNLLVRDFINAGWGIPTGGIPIPSGGTAIPVHRPGPPGTSLDFGTALTLSGVNPGEDLGPATNGQATDIVSILYADNMLALNEKPLVDIDINSANVVVEIDGTTPITGISNAVREGDLIAISNALGNTLLYVTDVSGQIIRCESGDPLNLNQPFAPQGSASCLDNGDGTYPPTTATRVMLVTYYLDTTTDSEMPRLIRRINNRAGEAVALVLENLQLSYDLVDGVTNPTYVKTPVAPNSPNQIRKANILLSGRSSAREKNTKEFLRRTLTTQVSLRSLAFIDRYK